MLQKNYAKILLIFLASLSHLKINSWWFDILPIKQIIQEDASIQYKKCFDPIDFNYAEFPLSLNQSWHPNQGRFDETFVITIPNGTLQSKNGFTVINNHFIDEMIWKKFMHNLQLVKQYNYKPQYFAKRVAVITQPAYANYFHWLTEVLCRLALLEISGEPYDYIYTPQDRAYIKGTLDLWEIPQEKILVPSNDGAYIQAKEVIIPSLVSNSSLNSVYFSCYAQPHLIKYVINKLLTAAKQFPSEHKESKRIFISRKDAPQRKLLNEEDVFALLKPHGFVRYELEHLSVTQQILLFHNAEIIISPQGTGLANCIFCTPETQIIELFQGLNDCTFWYLSQELRLNYTPIKTIEFSTNYFTGWSDNTSMPLDIIKNMVDKLQLK
jgi:hypothetical protein